MAKGAYIGVNDVARRVYKGYVGIDNIARRIKKAYIGMGGVARPFWANGLEYYGQIQRDCPLRKWSAATSTTSYALFAGGFQSTYSSDIDGFNASLTHYAPSLLSVARYDLAATTVGDIALFGGGKTSSSTCSDVVESTYNKSLASLLPQQLSRGKHSLAATTVGDYAVFAGGQVPAGAYQTGVDAYSSSMTHTTPSELSEGRYGLAATTVGDYAVFAGGYGDTSGIFTNSSGALKKVDAYNTALTKKLTVTALSEARYDLAATTVGGYALFSGGRSSNVVDAYDTSLTRTTLSGLSMSQAYRHGASTVGKYALFVGGLPDQDTTCVDIYDASLIKTTMSIAQPTQSCTGATIGEYAVFLGNLRLEGFRAFLE